MILLYSATIFLSAALLFLVEPMVGRFLLPLFGSTPAVWIVTVLFFQAALLAGYAYGHVATGRLGERRQAVIQLVLLAGAVVALPVSVPDDYRAPVADTPVLSLLALLVAVVGLPFFALASNGPVLQRWLSASGHRLAADPYFLFAASNAGSLVGLLAYPALLEPLLSLDDQADAWSAGYLALVLLVAGCAAALWRAGGATRSAGGAPPGTRPESIAGPSSAGLPARLRWLALAFVPSSFMLGTTAYITRDLAAIPLLWVIPLALYLLSFAIVFARRVAPGRVVRLSGLGLVGAVALLVYTIALGVGRPLWALLALHLVGLFLAALMCHGRLAVERPPARELTAFYLWVGLGGVLGGVFNALLAPIIFPTLIEYPLAIVAACLLRPPPAKRVPGLLEFLTKDPRPTRVMDGLVPAILGVAVALALHAADWEGSGAGSTVGGAVIGVAVGLAVNTARRPVRFALAMGAILVGASVAASAGEEVLARDRTFFGIYRVEKESARHLLIDGTTIHGVQALERRRPPEPLSYYRRGGPVGQALTTLPAARRSPRIAVVGLGAGTLACYGRPGQRFTFFEIDPAVARIARDPRLFNYLRECPARSGIVLGDGRRSLAAERGSRYGAIALDAFTSDAVPTHLITREAMELYLRRLEPHGTILFNITNRYTDLEPVLGALAADRRAVCLAREERITARQEERGYTNSKWAVVARRGSDLGRLGSDRRWHRCERRPGARVWSDDYSSTLSVLRWG